MKKILLLLLLPGLAYANWRKLGPDGGQAVSREVCEQVFGAPCLQEAQPIPSDLKDDDLLQEEDGKLVINQKALEQARAAEKEAAAQALADAEARKTKIEASKAIVESKDPSPQELRDALKILLSDAADRSAAIAVSTDSVPVQAVLEGRKK